MRRTGRLSVLAFTAIVSLAATQTPSRITRIEFSPAPEGEEAGIDISLLGSGSCTYTLDFGDGKTERRTATLPDRTRHPYAADSA